MLRSLRSRLLLSHLLAVLLVAGTTGVYFYSAAADRVKDEIQNRLKYSAQLIAELLDERCMANITSRSDTAGVEYQTCLSQLRALRRSNDDIAFIYIMRRVADGSVIFVADSDETGQQAAPGDVYDNPPATLMEGFTKPAVDSELHKDEWGTFISGYAPIKTADREILVGIDMRANDFAKKLRSLTVIALLLLVFAALLALFLSAVVSKRLTGPISRLTERCRELAAGASQLPAAEQATVLEVSQLQAAFDDMVNHLNAAKESREQALSAVEHSRALLETRVSERTEELESLNVRLRQEVLEREVAQEELTKIATTDSLTGLLNRRALLDRLGNEIKHIVNQNQTVSLILFDIDWFKQVNDQYGHMAGDEVLVAVSKVLIDGCRKQDSVARWGGEEFLVMLPSTSGVEAMSIANKLRKQVSELQFNGANENSYQVTLSGGVHICDLTSTSLNNFRAADDALYAAKHSGRNKVKASFEMPVE